MNKIFLALLFSISVFSDTLVLEYSENCCEEFPIAINLISSNSVDGIAMNGAISASMIGDMLNTITGSAKLTFNRESDNKSFTIETPYFGFKPPNQCIYDFYDESIGKCTIDNPVQIEINSLFAEYWEPFEIISIKNNKLKVAHLFGFARGMSSHDVYRIINTQNQFEVKFLYNFPGNAEWNEDGTFTFDNPGGAAVDSKETYGEVNEDEWKLVKYTYSGMSYDSGPQYDHSGEWTGYCTLELIKKYNYMSGVLETIKDETTCPND